MAEYVMPDGAKTTYSTYNIVQYLEYEGRYYVRIDERSRRGRVSGNRK